MPGSSPADDRRFGTHTPTRRRRSFSPAAVIDLAARRGHPGKEVPVADYGDPLPSDAEIELATTIQALFLHRGGLSLADPATAAIYSATLEAVAIMLEGALRTGVVDEQQHATLRGMVEGLEKVPDVL